MKFEHVVHSLLIDAFLWCLIFYPRIVTKQQGKMDCVKKLLFPWLDMWVLFGYFYQISTKLVDIWFQVPRIKVDGS